VDVVEAGQLFARRARGPRDEELDLAAGTGDGLSAVLQFHLDRRGVFDPQTEEALDIGLGRVHAGDELLARGVSCEAVRGEVRVHAVRLQHLGEHPAVEARVLAELHGRVAQLAGQGRGGGWTSLVRGGASLCALFLNAGWYISGRDRSWQ